jgi:hypothetical protein
MVNENALVKKEMDLYYYRNYAHFCNDIASNPFYELNKI